MRPETEQSIVARLAPLRSVNVVVRAVPNIPAELGEPTGNGEVLLICKRGKAEKPSGMGRFQQEVNDEWHLTLTLKHIRSEAGVMTFINAIIALLLGFRPEQCGKLCLGSYEILGIDQMGFWRADLMFMATRLVLETSEDEAIALLSQITFETEVWDTPVEPDLVIPETAE
ncbi:Gp37 family protein [Leptolyngbya sp. AN02str]|uniref:Gp37 family protein n=1 Tax=Leptolyngbya sp. AN02str TaxID=3423363 RepID=UPI003D3231C8